MFWQYCEKISKLYRFLLSKKFIYFINVSFILQLKSSMGIRQYSVKSLRKSFDAVNMKDAARAAEDVLIENVAFQELSTNGSCSHDQE